mgnify:CR=1 FL=1
MKYHKVRPYSFWWLKWFYILYSVILALCTISYLITRNNKTLLGVMALCVGGIIYVAFIWRMKWYKASKFTRLIQKHIEENSLFETRQKGRRTVYTFYPNVKWKADEENNILYIRFELPGNKIDLRGLERNLADRLKKICINVYETYGSIEYSFQLNKENRLIISSKEDIQADDENKSIALSPSFSWKYRETPHLAIIGTTGSGKTTFIRFIIANLLKQGFRVLYLDIKRDTEMECFCRGNVAITYAYEPSHIAKEVADIADEIRTRKKSINDMEEKYDVEKGHDYGFNPVFVICDEIILMKLVFPDKLYKETITQINSIIVSGRSKNIFAGLISQSGLAEYFGNSGIRGNIGLKVALGQLTTSEYRMIFGEEFSDIKNLRYNEIGSGLIMRHGVDSRPREFVSPYIEQGVLD